MIEEEWGRCAPWLRAALARSPETFTLDDIRRFVDGGEAQFWPGKASAAVSDISPHFHIWLAGGDMADLLKMEADASVWAAERGCRRMTINGRKGWERALAPLGYRPRTVLSKEL